MKSTIASLLLLSINSALAVITWDYNLSEDQKTAAIADFNNARRTLDDADKRKYVLESYPVRIGTDDSSPDVRILFKPRGGVTGSMFYVVINESSGIREVQIVDIGALDLSKTKHSLLMRVGMVLAACICPQPIMELIDSKTGPEAPKFLVTDRPIASGELF